MDRTDKWPTTSQIEDSYVEALDQSNLPPQTAIDTVIQYADGPLNLWPIGLNLPFEQPERVTDTTMNIDGIDAPDAQRMLWEIYQDLAYDVQNAIERSVLNTLMVFGDWLNEIVTSIEDNFNDAINWIPPGDPLALDLDGDGIETIAADGYNGAMFDLDADGVRTATSWVSSVRIYH